MAFLTEAELKTAQHAEIIGSITRDDSTIVPIIISEQVAYMKGYLNSRYDVETEFAKEGEGRDLVVLKILKALVVYEIYSLGNPRMMTQVVKDNNDRAHTWLKAVQKGEINPDLEIPEDTSPVEYVKYGSNSKRSNHY